MIPHHSGAFQVQVSLREAHACFRPRVVRLESEPVALGVDPAKADGFEGREYPDPFLTIRKHAQFPLYRKYPKHKLLR